MSNLLFIDTSRHQGVMDMARVKAAGVDGHIGRLTVGDYYTDETGAQNYHKAKIARVPSTFYFVVAPAESNVSGSRRISAQAHVDRFTREIDKIGRPLIRCGPTERPLVVMDCELHRNTGREYTTSVTQGSLLLLEELGFTVWIYTAAGFWDANVLPWSGWSERPLHVANYTTAAQPYMPRDWSEWVAWQYSADGNGLGAEYGASSLSIDLNRVKPEYVKLGDDNVTDPQPYDIWSGRGVHVQELYEVFPALRKPYYDPAPYDPLAYAAEIDAFVQAQLDADITHVFIDAAVGNIKYNQRRVDATNYIDDAIQPLVDALHAAEIQVIGVQRLQDDTVVYGTERDQALTASARVQQFGMDSLLTWLPDNLTSARWRNRLNVYGGFLVYGEERSGVAPLEVPRGFCAPALPVEFPEYPWEQVFTGVPKFKSDDRLIWEYLNANYQVPRIEAESPVATINACVDAYAAGFWVDDPGDPNSTSPAAIWPALIATSATGAKVMEFEGKAASFAHSWSFWNLSELSADAAAYVYDEEPQEPPVEPPPATNPPDEVLFTVKIKGLPSGVTLRLRSTPTTAEAGNVVGMTWNDARFPVVDVAQDQNGKDWYCIGPKAPKSIWVASWYTAKV